MSKSALASLTAEYDSENEDDHKDDDSPDSENSQASSQVIIPIKAAAPEPRTETPVLEEKPEDKKEKKKRKRSKKMRRLVSYQDDTIISDDDNEMTTQSSESSEDESESDEKGDDNGGAPNAAQNLSARKEGGDASTTPMTIDDEASAESASQTKTLSKSEVASKYAHYSFNLPPEPRGKPTQELVEKIRNLYQKMETHNMDMNRIIQERKEFRNPSIYEKLIQFCNINEFGTNYPPEIYDPLQWGTESFYEELDQVQQTDMLRRKKERKDMDKKEQATALARKVEEEAKKRKSKWDQPAAVKPVIPTALTTTVTGTKGTVIQAFGSLPKKP